MPVCLWRQQAEVAALTTSGRRPSGRKEQLAAPMCTRGPSFSALREMHSLCLPWAQALVITGFKPCPPRESGRAAHSSRCGLTGPQGSPSPRGETGLGLRREQLGMSRPRPCSREAFHALRAASPHLLPPGWPSVALCPTIPGPLSWDTLLDLPCPTPPGE